MIKSIGYAYPTSTFAKRLKRSAKGCFYVMVKTSEDAFNFKSLNGPFATKYEAEQFAAGLDMPFSRYTMRAL